MTPSVNHRRFLFYHWISCGWILSLPFSSESSLSESSSSIRSYAGEGDNASRLWMVNSAERSLPDSRSFSTISGAARKDTFGLFLDACDLSRRRFKHVKRSLVRFLLRLNFVRDFLVYRRGFVPIPF